MSDDALRAAIGRIEDREAIREVLARYSRGIDRIDPDLIRSVFHPDAHDDHGPFKGSPEEFIEWIVPFMRSEYFATSHHMTTHSIDLDGDVAYAETYAIVSQFKIRDGEQYETVANARYIDRLERRDGEWRIADRLVVTDSARTSKAPPFSGTTPASSLGGGTRDRTDPVYTRRGVTSAG
ncbi:Putative lumazine-binding [Mycobacterium tuberculosis]|nr:Putative lumazine-binding [Mycobacterium tuberculosis]